MNSKMIAKFDEVISNAVLMGSDEILINKQNDLFFINYVANENKQEIVKYDEGMQFCEAAFTFLKTNQNESFNYKKSQSGKISYRMGKIKKKITYLSSVNKNNNFSISLSLYSLPNH